MFIPKNLPKYTMFGPFLYPAIFDLPVNTQAFSCFLASAMLHEIGHNLGFICEFTGFYSFLAFQNVAERWPKFSIYLWIPRFVLILSFQNWPTSSIYLWIQRLLLVASSQNVAECWPESSIYLWIHMVLLVSSFQNVAKCWPKSSIDLWIQRFFIVFSFPNVAEYWAKSSACTCAFTGLC